MKALTFEEWDKFTEETTACNGEYWRSIFDAARQGMIPEDEAVRIPPVEKWPERASGILVGYYEDSKAVADGESTMFPFGFFRHIPRPAPAWTPRIGEACFTGDSTTVIMPTQIDGDIVRTERNGSFYAVDCKPFDASKIGRPWEEI